MKERMDYFKTDPKALRGMLEMEKYVAGSELDPVIFELVKTRASQINGCAYCLDMHTKDARHAGETEQRLYSLSAWRDAPFYSERERVALEYTEALTLISENEISDTLYKKSQKYFTEKELLALTITIVAINGWNRIAIAFRKVPGSYQIEEKTETVI